jgi:uncharacterized protein YjbI with pentapeptide repeats
MANPEHVTKLKEGVAAWNNWRKTNPQVEPDLSRANLWGADLYAANLSEADLRRANLGKVNLRRSDARGADLVAADLTEADLVEANLTRADLSGSILKWADLARSELVGTNFTRASLTGSNFASAGVWNTIFVDSDLSAARGLETIQHLGPSSIAIDTIYRSKGQIPESFLRGCGVPDDFITFMKSLSANSIDFYSCFISYSFADQDFAERLHSDLQNKGVRCWFAPHDMQSGKKLHEQIDHAIRLHDKLLLLLSPHSMESEWVRTEIAKAREREVRENRRVLFPIRLAPFETLSEWECFDADSGKDSAREIREYFIPDFSNWKNHDSYQEAFQRLISDLKSLESKVLPKSSGQ